MARSLQQQYDDNDAAIHAVETGAQAFSEGGDSATKATLATLYKERDRLERLIARAGRPRLRPIQPTNL